MTVQDITFPLLAYDDDFCFSFTDTDALIWVEERLLVPATLYHRLHFIDATGIAFRVYKAQVTGQVTLRSDRFDKRKRTRFSQVALSFIVAPGQLTTDEVKAVTLRYFSGYRGSCDDLPANYGDHFLAIKTAQTIPDIITAVAFFEQSEDQPPVMIDGDGIESLTRLASREEYALFQKDTSQLFFDIVTAIFFVLSFSLFPFLVTAAIHMNDKDSGIGMGALSYFISLCIFAIIAFIILAKRHAWVQPRKMPQVLVWRCRASAVVRVKIGGNDFPNGYVFQLENDHILLMPYDNRCKGDAFPCREFDLIFLERYPELRKIVSRETKMRSQRVISYRATEGFFPYNPHVIQGSLQDVEELLSLQANNSVNEK